MNVYNLLNCRYSEFVTAFWCVCMWLIPLCQSLDFCLLQWWWYISAKQLYWNIAEVAKSGLRELACFNVIKVLIRHMLVLLWFLRPFSAWHYNLIWIKECKWVSKEKVTIFKRVKMIGFFSWKSWTFISACF